MTTFKKYLVQESATNNKLIQVPGIGKMLVGQVRAKVYGMVEDILNDIRHAGQTPDDWKKIQYKLSNDALQAYVATLIKLEQEKQELNPV